jgi:hypothetical protein
MTVIASTIGPKGLYLLFIWLVSAAIAGWMAERKGYGERVGLTFGLVLSVIGLLIVIVLPGRPGSKWKLEGWRPGGRRAPTVAGASMGPALAGPGAVASGPSGLPAGEAPEPAAAPSEPEPPEAGPSEPPSPDG